MRKNESQGEITVRTDDLSAKRLVQRVVEDEQLGLGDSIEIDITGGSLKSKAKRHPKSHMTRRSQATAASNTVHELDLKVVTGEPRTPRR